MYVSMYYIFVEVNSGQYSLKLSFVINKQEWIVAAVKSKRDIDIYPTLDQEDKILHN
jgi:hypothetical protein